MELRLLLVLLQVFRTEHWARILGNNSSLSLMSVGKSTLPPATRLDWGCAPHRNERFDLQ